uniref:Uncharacterized protein n=1 Tax=Candidatus Kentrum sp. TUN TaxID=2126343 RepID=A0A451A013_9GAMM|nr:MAG: hypothetical protein BECKTUN1418D_GA0071000_10172 [Candidatus Kentron sp. TUN]VFK59368.1 MAG: hypothetical protein BECKTUN1418F_GA0071002_11734 [Candidatus Kentron sp. TUN]VFK67944.1 MAG: hypothetical protein BECKTUN1418E_GA0071001_11704 [Candidatus Kentron sp. TUN]
MTIPRKENTVFRFSLIVGMALVGLSLLPPSNMGFAGEQPACMITKHDGGVSLAIGGSHARPLMNFMTLRDGDQLSLARGEEVKLVCFGTPGGVGRMETWFGPVTLVVNRNRTHSDGKQAVEIQTLPIKANFDHYMIAVEDQSMAGLTLRTIPRRNGVTKIVTHYCHLRREAPMGNFVPEHYLFSNLEKEGFLDTFDDWLKASLKEQPENTCWRGIASKLPRLLPVPR